MDCDPAVKFKVEASCLLFLAMNGDLPGTSLPSYRVGDPLTGTDSEQLNVRSLIDQNLFPRCLPAEALVLSIAESKTTRRNSKQRKSYQAKQSLNVQSSHCALDIYPTGFKNECLAHARL